MQIFRNLRQGISNLIKWFPIIWLDRNWDQYFLYEILAAKLEHMDEFYESNKRISVKDEMRDKISFAKELSRRLADDDYLSEALIEYDKIYGDNDLYSVDKSGKMTEVGTKEQHKMFYQCGKEADKMRYQDRVE